MSKNIKHPFLFLCCTALSACAYYQTDTIQNITFETLGAENAICYAYVDNVKYKIRPPMMMPIKKDKDPMVLDCIAPGNRNKKLEIKPTIEQSTWGNALNGGIPGGSWDFASDAMFHYPEKIYVDFRGMPTTPMPLPDHNSKDIRPPESYDLEEFLPSHPRMNADKYYKAPKLQRREEYLKEFSSDETGLSDSDYNPSNAPGKGDLSPVQAQSLSAPSSGSKSTSSVSKSTEDGTGAESTQSSGAPAQLFPLD